MEDKIEKLYVIQRNEKGRWWKSHWTDMYHFSDLPEATEEYLKTAHPDAEIILEQKKTVCVLPVSMFYSNIKVFIARYRIWDYADGYESWKELGRYSTYETAKISLRKFIKNYSKLFRLVEVDTTTRVVPTDVSPLSQKA